LKDIINLLRRNNVDVIKMSYPELKISDNVQKVLDGGGYGSMMTDNMSNTDELPTMKRIRYQVRQVEVTESTLQTDFWNLKNKFRA
jgi:hypothetical protein